MKNSKAPQRKLVVLGSARRLTKDGFDGNTPELAVGQRYNIG